MRYMISIDFGSAYTKVGIRHSLNEPSRFITEQSLVMDADRFCIPTLAAVTERAGKARWEFGPEATTIVEGNGIKVYRNWKPKLFSPVRNRKEMPVIASHQAAGRSNRRFSDSTTPPPTSTGYTDLDIKAVTVKYFTWLRKFLAAPCERLGVHDLGVVPVRLCVPDFGTNGRATDDYSPSEELLLEILADAGWNPDDECPIVTEPETNAIGIYTQGKNATWSPTGPRGKKYIHFLQMMNFGDYLPALRRRSLRRDDRSNHCVLVIDIGAFTTDLAFLDFDLNDENNPPSVTGESKALGVQDLDQLVLSRLPEAKSFQVRALNARRREELKRSLYMDDAAYRLEGNVTIGTDAEGELIRQCVLEFAKHVRDFLGRFLQAHQITQLDEVILTGGGNLIPRLSSSLVNSILKRELGTKLVHSPMSAPVAPNPHYHHNRLDSRLVRGSSGIGGASVYFEKRFW